MLRAYFNIIAAVIGLWLTVSSGFCGEIGKQHALAVELKKNEILEVKVQRLVVDPQSQQPVVSLSDLKGDRVLLIWIDLFEARAIYSELEGVKHFRPLTHDLLEKVIEKVDGKIQRVIITHIKENTYFATIVLKKGNTLVEVDARPSDSIVMALKFKAPIFVAKNLFEKMSLPMEDKIESDDAYGLTLQNLTPELAAYLAFESDRGALVSNVRNGSNAHQDGIESGDIFVEVEGEIIEDAAAMKNVLSSGQTSIEVKVFRKSRLLTLTLHP
jgi:uncharacterized protein